MKTTLDLQNRMQKDPAFQAKLHAAAEAAAGASAVAEGLIAGLAETPLGLAQLRAQDGANGAALPTTISTIICTITTITHPPEMQS